LFEASTASCAGGKIDDLRSREGSVVGATRELPGSRIAVLRESPEIRRLDFVVAELPSADASPGLPEPSCRS